MLKNLKAQVGRASDIKNGTWILHETFQYGRFKTYGDFTYSYLLDQWLLQLAGKNPRQHTAKTIELHMVLTQTWAKCSFSVVLGVETIILSSHDLLHNSHREGCHQVLLLPGLASVCCEAVRSPQRRLHAGTVNPVAKPWEVSGGSI